MKKAVKDISEKTKKEKQEKQEKTQKTLVKEDKTKITNLEMTIDKLNVNFSYVG